MPSLFKKFMRLFELPPLIAIKEREYYEAQTELLKAQTGFDYAKAMVIYNQARVDRLKADIGSYNGK